MKDRIKQLMDAQHMNQQTFATYTGIGTASLSSIFTGRTRPTLNHVDAILEKFPNVNPMWLLKGIGGMMLSADDNNNANNSLSSDNDSNTQNPPSAGQNGSQSNYANMSVEQSLFNNNTTSNHTRNVVNNSGTKSPSSFHFEEESKQHIVQRKITEIRVFYDDQTWESFVPKKEK